MPFQKGQSGNPRGRPKRPFADALRIEITESKGDFTRLRKVAKRLIEEAEQGNMQAIKEIADRLDGKAQQPITGGDEPIEVKDVSDNAESFKRAIIGIAARSGAAARD